MVTSIVPRPRRVDLTGDGGDPTVVSDHLDHRLPPQGYRLTIGPSGTRLEHADHAGRRYGLDTLSQLAAGEAVGEGVVEDWPAIAVRAYMLDISRDRVPTNEMLDWLVGVLGRLRVNELQLYTEHTFAWPDHEIVWRDASPLTAEDLRWLRGRCAAEGIDLVPCLNGFGHMERFLRHERYRHRAECPDGAPSPSGRGTVPPTTLAPTPDNAAFTLDLYRRYLEASPSPLIHIGADEPFELGRCRTRERVEAQGRAAVYLEHLRRLVDPLLADGRQVLFWGDVLRTAPEHVAALPDEGVTPVVWHYEAPVPGSPPLSEVLGRELVELLGMPEDGLEGFGAHTRTFVQSDLPFRVAPGTSTWNSLIGRWPNARDNISDAVLTGIAQDATGMLLTDWGDNGHHQPPAVSLPPLVHAAAASWSGDGRPLDDLAAVIDRLVDDSTGGSASSSRLGHRLVEVGEVHHRLGARSFNASPLFEALRHRVHVDPTRFASRDEVQAALDLLEDTADRHGSLPLLGPGLAAACDLARVGVERLAAGAGQATRPEGEVDASLRAAIERQREAWPLTSRSGGSADSLARLRSTLST